jgi:ribosomal protein L11 methyltransferase
MESGFVEVEIQADDSLREHLAAILGQIGFEGFWEDEETLRGYIQAGRWSPSMLEEVHTITALVARSSSSPFPRIRVASIPDRNWNEEWERTIRPVLVTPRIVITPTWHNYTPTAGQIVLTIDPKMSFGTGYHESTRLMLRLMERHLRPGMRLLDFGTGTGILAIAGIRLGAESAVAVDVDQWSIRNAAENVHLNKVDRQVRIVQGDIDLVDSEPFDMIVANIHLNVIEPNLATIRGRLNPAGMALLSGLLLDDEEEISQALAREGLTVVDRLTENEWVALAVAKTD